mmetsp:Transcript_13593/g.25535  ORF Transcript_13593/g.25535 Transcript_13593/m.25535 type:complete len:157 (+) Transcript_13593:117-587(+)
MFNFCGPAVVFATIILIVATPSLVVSFQAAPVMRSGNGVLFSSKPEADIVTYFDDLVEAVKASTTFGMYGPDKLQELADKVEAGASSCMFEVDGGELCQKEIDDRLDVAEVLRMQAELQLRMEAIEGSSLFADDCLAEDMIRQRENFMDYLAEDGL